MSEGPIMKLIKAELEACYQVRRDYELAEENSGKKFHAIPVCHGDVAYVSWDAEVWLCTTIATLREKLTKAEERIEAMKNCRNCEHLNDFGDYPECGSGIRCTKLSQWKSKGAHR